MPVVTADSTNTVLEGPYLAANGAGDEVIVWQADTTDPTTGQTTFTLQAAYRQAGSSWGPVQTIEGPESPGFQIGGVSVDSSGAATVVYNAGAASGGCSTQAIKVARRSASGGWTARSTGLEGMLAAAAANVAGDLVIGWQSGCATSTDISYEVNVDTYSAQRGWGAPADLYHGDIDTVRVAIDGSGDARALVLPYGQTGAGDWLAFAESEGSWSTSQALPVPQSEANVQLGMSDAGRALAVCDCTNPGTGAAPGTFGALEAGPGQAFGSLEAISAPDGWPWNPYLSFDSAGDATVLWWDNEAENNGFYAVDQSASGTWGTSALVPGSSGYWLRGTAENAGGDVAGVTNSPTTPLAVFYRRAGGSFAGAEPLSVPGGNAGSAQIVMPDDGVPTVAALTANSSGESQIVSWDRQNLQSPSITQGISGTTDLTAASFSFATSDSGVKFQCRLDGSGTAGFSACSSPQTYAALRPGQHTFSVREVDASGNPGPASSESWTVNTTAPSTAIESGPLGDTADTDVTFSFSSSQPDSTFECTLDGGASEPCQSPQSYGGLALGSHTFRVAATDSLGNVDLQGASRRFTVVSALNGGTCPLGEARDPSRARAASCGGVKCPAGSSSSAKAGPFVVAATAPAGCFTKSRRGSTSRGPVELNGIPVTVPGGVSLTVGQKNISASAPVRLSFGPLQSVTVKVNWKVPSSSKTTISLAGTNSAFSRLTSGALASPALSGMKIKAEASLVFSAAHGGTTTLGFGLKLPTSLSAGGKGKKPAQLEVSGQLVLANGEDPNVKLHAGIPKVLVYKVLQLDGLSVDYDSSDSKLEAHGGLTLPGGRSVVMDLAFRGGLLTSYSIVANPQLPIPPDTCLTQLSVAGTRAFGASPASLELGGGVSFGLPVAAGCDLEPIRVNGTVKLEYAGSPLKPATITIHGTGSLYSLQVADLTASWDVAAQTLELSGTLGLNLAAVTGQIKIGNGDASYSVQDGKFNIQAATTLGLHIPSVPSQLKGTIHIDNAGIVACTAGGMGFSVPWGGGIASITPHLSGCRLDELG